MLTARDIAGLLVWSKFFQVGGDDDASDDAPANSVGPGSRYTAACSRRASPACERLERYSTASDHYGATTTTVANATSTVETQRTAHNGVLANTCGIQSSD
jgi:hypothetical protein